VIYRGRFYTTSGRKPHPYTRRVVGLCLKHRYPLDGLVNADVHPQVADL
jgi:hypothetical protein